MIAVVWEADAARDVEEAWTTASEARRSQLASAMEAIHDALRDAPLLVGESRQDAATRVYSVPPLTVYFRVSKRLNLVRVYAARVYSQP